MLLGAVAAFLLTRSIASRIKKMLTAADGLADGDVDQHIDATSKDEIGQTAAAFQRMIDYFKTMVAAAGRMAEGDLSVEVEPRSERDALGNSFSAMIADLRDLVGKLSEAAGSVSMASQQMSSTSEEAGKATGEIATAIGDVAQGAERQVNLVESAKRAAEEVAAAVNESAEQAEHTAEVATRARRDRPTGRRRGRTGQRGDGVCQRLKEQGVSDAIRELAGKSEQIGAIVATITGIAEQTNLLALNVMAFST